MKLIKFDLPIHGTKVRSLEELRDNLSDEILALARSGQLERWLRTQRLPESARAVAAAVQREGSDKNLFLALCAALEVEVHPDDVKAVFDAPPVPGRLVSGARSVELPEASSHPVAGAERIVHSAGAGPVGSAMTGAKRVKKVTFSREFIDTESLSFESYNIIFWGSGLHRVLKIHVEPGTAVLKGAPLVEVLLNDSLVQVHSPMPGIVERVFVHPGRNIRVGDELLAISEAAA